MTGKISSCSLPYARHWRVAPRLGLKVKELDLPLCTFRTTGADRCQCQRNGVFFGDL